MDIKLCAIKMENLFDLIVKISKYTTMPHNNYKDDLHDMIIHMETKCLFPEITQ